MWIRKHRFLQRGLIALLALPVAGCATMLNRGNQSVLINSSPPGATVLKSGKELGTTPYTYTVGKDDKGSVELELKMEGREPSTVQVRTQAAGPVLFADAMLLGIPYIVDHGNPASRSVRSKELTVHLYKATPAQVQQLELPIAPLEHNLPDGAVLGRKGHTNLKITNRELGELYYPRQGTGSIARGLRNTFVDAYAVQPGTTKSDQDLVRAKVVLKPWVKKVDLQLDKGKGKVNGSARLEVDWRFFSTVSKDSLLFTVQTDTKGTYDDVYPSELLATALADAARLMLDDDGLYERLAEARTKGISMAKGDAVTLAKPKPIVFADRRTMFPELVKAVVTVEMKDGHGSGFLITNDGYLLTNAHVVGSQAHAKVRFQQGFSLDGQVVKVNRDFDLALLKVAGNDLPALTLGNDGELVLGEELFAVGTPLDERLGQSVSRGIMSGRREIDGRKYLQTDVSINPGNSGGPLINEDGQVVGVTTMKVSAAGVEGIGFGVPISTVLEMLNIQLGTP